MNKNCVKIGVSEGVPSELLSYISAACFNRGFSVHYFRPEEAAAVPEVFSNIDWQELREQKEWLLAIHLPQAEGLVELLDHFQDQACEAGIPEATVFGQQHAYNLCPLPADWRGRLDCLSWPEGWCLSSRGDGCLEIQKLDEPAEGGQAFALDNEALTFVTTKAMAGSALHMLALFMDGRGDGDEVLVPLAMAEVVSVK